MTLAALPPVENTKIAIALSGGVDSSVVAAELKTAGYDLVAFFMRNWTAAIDDTGYCPWIEDSASARVVADQLDIPFYLLDFESIYKQEVIDPFFAEYAAGRTPNPDVLCNQVIKFGAFWREVQKFGCTHIATGHYARLGQADDQLLLLRGVDPAKDQSYFLWTLTKEMLSHTLFPLGNRPKDQVRQTAKEYGLSTADRPDSQGICFIGPISLRDFLRSQIPASPGPVKDPDGTIVGEHDGLAFATIGQRRGMGASGTGQPLYVAKKEPETNTLWVVPEDHPALFSKEFTVDQVSTVSGQPLPKRAVVTVRYHHPGVPAKLKKLRTGGYQVKLDQPERAVTPGQSAVLFDDEQPDILLGGGIINEVVPL